MGDWKTTRDERFLNEAIKVAQQCDHTTLSAFRVGAVLVQDGGDDNDDNDDDGGDGDSTIVASGFSRETGETQHAEEVCLDKARQLLIESKSRFTLYCTMEPCAERLTPDRATCVELILKHKACIHRVVFGAREPACVFVDQPRGAVTALQRGIQQVDQIGDKELIRRCEQLNEAVCQQVTRQKVRVHRAAQALAEGKFVVLADERRWQKHDEAHLLLAAHFATAEKIEYLRRMCSGIIGMAMSEQRCQQLGLLTRLVTGTGDEMELTVSVDAVGTSTGVSGTDRARTAQVLANAQTKARDLQRPGHLYPFCARNGGVLERRALAEASIDLLLLAAKHSNTKSAAAVLLSAIVAPSSNICNMMGAAQGLKLADKLQFASVTLDDVVAVMRLEQRRRRPHQLEDKSDGTINSLDHILSSIPVPSPSPSPIPFPSLSLSLSWWRILIAIGVAALCWSHWAETIRSNLT